MEAAFFIALCSILWELKCILLYKKRDFFVDYYSDITKNTFFIDNCSLICYNKNHWNYGEEIAAKALIYAVLRR